MNGEDAHLESAYEDRQSQEIMDLLDWGDDWYEDDVRCPACGDTPQYCQGHGEMGDPRGYAILECHDGGEHDECFGGDQEMIEKYCD